MKKLLPFVFSCLLLGGCADVSAPIVEEPIEYMPSDIFAESMTTLPFTLPYYPLESLHPTLVENATNGDLASLLYEGLFLVNEQFVAEPVLVESWSQSQDGYGWTFTLKEGILFWDGTELTAQRVISAWNEAKSSGSRYSARFSGISSYSGSGYTITVQLSTPNFNLPVLLDIPISSGGGDLPMGTGPYLYETSIDDNGEKVWEDVLQRNPHWWGEETGPEEILLLPIQGKTELISAFDAGQISMLQGHLTEDNFGFSGNYQVWEYPTTDFYYLGFSTERLTADFRKNISLGLQRETLLSQELAGYGVATVYPVHPHSETGQWLGDWAYDPLLSGEALYPYGGRSLDLLVNGDNTQKVSMAEELARQLGEYGLEVSVNALPWSEYLSALEAKDFDMYLGELYLRGDFNLSDLFFREGSHNYAGYDNEYLELLWQNYCLQGLDAVSEEGDFFFHYFLEEMPFAPLCFETGTALSLWGHLNLATPLLGNLFHNLPDWDIVTE